MATSQPGVGQGAVMTPDMPKYKTSDEVDFVVIGSGAAGGIIAKELSQNGFRVVVLEQGPYLTESKFLLRLEADYRRSRKARRPNFRQQVSHNRDS